MRVQLGGFTVQASRPDQRNVRFQVFHRGTNACVFDVRVEYAERGRGVTFFVNGRPHSGVYPEGELEMVEGEVGKK